MDVYSDDDDNDGGEGDDKNNAGDDENDVNGDGGYTMERGDNIFLRWGGGIISFALTHVHTFITFQFYVYRLN